MPDEVLGAGAQSAEGAFADARGRDQCGQGQALVDAACRRTSDQLSVWGLGEQAFAAVLIVSGLVTNAIRYGSAPSELRLLRGDTLVCEVSDGSSTAAHLRRARFFDEGGRGLLLVAQLAKRWGSRQTPTGKTI